MTEIETNETEQTPTRSTFRTRSRYRGLPVVFIAGADGEPRPAPYLLSAEDVADLLRLRDSRTKFPSKTLQRYRRMGLRSVRAGRKTWYALPDVLDFLDRQQRQWGNLP